MLMRKTNVQSCITSIPLDIEGCAGRVAPMGKGVGLRSAMIMRRFGELYKTIYSDIIWTLNGTTS